MHEIKTPHNREEIRASRNLNTIEVCNEKFCESQACEEVIIACLESSVPTMGDWCVVELCTAEKVLREPLIIHRNTNQLTSSGLQNLAHLNHLWDNQVPEYSSCEHGSFLHRLARDPDHLTQLRALNLYSYVTAPLISPTKIWGWATWFSVQAPEAVGEDDKDKVEALAISTAVALEQAAEKFKTDEMIDLKNRFVSMVSHELRAPLNITLGWSGILLDNTNLDEETRKGLEIIYRNTREQAEIITNLLDATRIDLGKLSLDFKNVHLATFIEQNLQALSVLAKDKRVNLRCRIEAPFARLMADPIRLHQVLQNLVVNAIKFTPQSGNIIVSLEEDSRYVSISVEDDGEGISAEFLTQVFDRYKQHAGHRSYQPGLGLGLSIVRELVHAHGGEIKAESRGLGKGSTFTARFPKERSNSISADQVVH